MGGPCWERNTIRDWPDRDMTLCKTTNTEAVVKTEEWIIISKSTSYTNEVHQKVNLNMQICLF